MFPGNSGSIPGRGAPLQRRQTVGGQQRQPSLGQSSNRSANAAPPTIGGRGQSLPQQPRLQPRPPIQAGRGGYAGPSPSGAPPTINPPTINPPTLTPRNYAPYPPSAPPPRTPTGYHHMPPPPRRTTTMGGPAGDNFPSQIRPLNVLLKPVDGGPPVARSREQIGHPLQRESDIPRGGLETLSPLRPGDPGYYSGSSVPSTPSSNASPTPRPSPRAPSHPAPSAPSPAPTTRPAILSQAEIDAMFHSRR